MRSFFFMSLCTAMLWSIPAFSKPALQEKTEFYDIQGTTTKQLLQAIVENGFEEKDGSICAAHTDWRVNWDLKYFPQGDQACALTDFKVSVTAEYLLPQFSNIENAPADLKQKWQTFIHALTFHEQGHKDLAVQAAGDIEAAFKNLPPESNCNELRQSANAEAEKIIRGYRKKEKQYDIDTDHGKTQGAVL